MGAGMEEEIFIIEVDSRVKGKVGRLSTEPENTETMCSH